MIARLAIAPEALDDLDNLGARASKREHERLVQLVQEHGALVFADDDSASQFIRRIRAGSSSLPAGVGKRWSELAVFFHKAGRLRTARPALTSPLTALPMGDHGAAWASNVDIAVVDEATAQGLGVPLEEGLITDPDTGFEVALPDSIAATSHLHAIKELRDRGFHGNGTPRDDFWHDVLEPIWDVSTHVTVLDRYLFARIWRERHDEHVQWLLRWLDQAPGRRGRVTLIGEALTNQAADVSEVLDVVGDACSGGRIDMVTVKLTPPPRRGQPPYLPHDRHIRFDSAGVYLNAGFDRLEHPTITAHDGLVWEYRWSPQALQALRDVEARASRARGLQTAEWHPAA